MISWWDGPLFPSPLQHWLIWQCAPSFLRGAGMLLTGLQPLLLLWISVLVLFPGSLTLVPTQGFLVPQA